MSLEGDDRTMVTGSPSDGVRPGQVVGERYEVRRPLPEGPFTLDYEALDQETEKLVRLRILRPALVPTDQARQAACVEAQETVGVGGRFLPGLLDADREAGRVYVVEAAPSGACLREVLDNRVAEGRHLQPDELLPVVARLAAALESVPPPWSHGDVRAEHVWVDPEHLQLLGAFVVPSLPLESVQQVVGSDPELARRLGPEVAKGAVSDAADRFGVATIAWEALTGHLPGRGGPQPPGAVGHALQALLSPDPGRRPTSLAELVGALAEQAGLPVPELDPGAFRRRRRLAVGQPRKDTVPFKPPGDDEGTARVAASAVEATRRQPMDLVPDEASERTRPRLPDESDRTQPRARRIEGADREGTMEISADQLLEQAPVTHGGSVDSMDSGELDPRLVRAALDVALDAQSSEELEPDDLEEVNGSEPGGAPPRKSPKTPTLELKVDELEELDETGPETTGAAPAKKAPPSQHTAPEVQFEVPEGVKPVPRPRLDSEPPPGVERAAGGAATDSSDGSLYDDSRSVPAVPAAAPPDAGPPRAPSPPPSTGAPASASPPAAAAPSAPAARAPGQRRSAPPKRGSGRGGLWIVLAAVLLAAVILGASLLIASWRQRSEEEQRIQRRFEELRQQSQQ